MSDLRPSMAAALSAFGVPATVRRAAPNDAPVTTTGFWVRSLHEEVFPAGTDLRIRDPRRVFVLQKSAALASLQRNDLLEAPEELGGTPQWWRVDSLDQVDSDCWRAVVVLAR